MTGHAGEIARAFDADFARPLAPRAANREDMLAIRVGDEPYLVVRGELAGLFADKPVTPLPGGPPGLLGISGFRGAVIAVYDLRAVLGVGGTAGGDAPRWVVMAAAAPVALAFDRFEAFLRVPGDAIAGHSGAAAGHVRRAAPCDGELRPIIDVPSIVAAIRARARGEP